MKTLEDNVRVSNVKPNMWNQFHKNTIVNVHRISIRYEHVHNILIWIVYNVILL